MTSVNSLTQALSPKSSDHDDQRLRCHWLLLSLVALHLIVPLLGNLGTTGGRGLLLVSYLVVLMAAVRSLAMRQRQVRIACLLAIPIVGVAVALLVAGNDLRDVLLGAVSVPFIMFTGACVLEYVLKGSRLTEDRLIGAAAVFLLAVHAWGGIYATIELVSPGSFAENTLDGSVCQGLVPHVVERDIDARHQTGVGTLVHGNAVSEWGGRIPARIGSGSSAHRSIRSSLSNSSSATPHFAPPSLRIYVFA